MSWPAGAVAGTLRRAPHFLGETWYLRRWAARTSSSSASPNDFQGLALLGLSIGVRAGMK